MRKGIGIHRIKVGDVYLCDGYLYFIRKRRGDVITYDRKILDAFRINCREDFEDFLEIPDAYLTTQEVKLKEEIIRDRDLIKEKQKGLTFERLYSFNVEATLTEDSSEETFRNEDGYSIGMYNGKQVHYCEKWGMFLCEGTEEYDEAVYMGLRIV